MPRSHRATARDGRHQWAVCDPDHPTSLRPTHESCHMMNIMMNIMNMNSKGLLADSVSSRGSAREVQHVFWGPQETGHSHQRRLKQAGQVMPCCLHNVAA